MLVRRRGFIEAKSIIRERHETTRRARGGQGGGGPGNPLARGVEGAHNGFGCPGSF